MRTALALGLALVFLYSAGAPAQAGPDGTEINAKDRALVQAIKAQRLAKIEFKDLSLEEALKWLRVATGRNYFIKRVPLAKADIDWQEIRYTISFDNVSLASVLEVLLDPYEMSWVVKDNVVYITSKVDSLGKPLTRLYAISHITWRKVDFIAPEINLNPSGFVEEEYTPEVEVENDPLASGDAVAEILREIVMPAGWAENDSWAIRATDTYLVVRAPPAIHALIPSALGKIAAMK